MGRKASEDNLVAAHSEAIKKKIKEGVPGEYRVKGEKGLVLIVSKTAGVGTFYLFYRNAQGQRQKLRLGVFGDDADQLTLAKASELAENKRAVVNQGQDPVTEAKALAASFKFEDLANRFLSEGSLSAKTRDVYRYSLQRHAYPVIGNKPVKSVMPADIVRIRKTIHDSGNKVQAERVKAMISGVFRWCRTHLDPTVENPCRDLGQLTKAKARTRNVTDDEIKTLWRGLDREDANASEAMKLILRLSILTGQRRSEIAGARVSELHALDTDVPRWVIPGDVTKRGKLVKEGRTKNGLEQVVPLSKEAASLFREAIGAKGRDKKSEYVFPARASVVKVEKGEPDTPHINGNSVTMAMRRQREALNIEDLSVHDMRRAISNWLKDQGVSIEVRDLVLNHKPRDSVTEKHYANSARMEPQVRLALQGWANHVMKVVGASTVADNVVALRA